MVAVADLAGGDLAGPGPQGGGRAVGERTAADSTLGERLLADLRAVFGTADKMWTETILDGLHKISEAPWGDWYGRPLNRPRPGQAAASPFGVAPST